MNKISVVCVKKMMKNRRSYSAATCAAIFIGAGHPLRKCGVCAGMQQNNLLEKNEDVTYNDMKKKKK